MKLLSYCSFLLCLSTQASYFCESYNQCREEFTHIANEHFFETKEFLVHSQVDDDLKISTAYFEHKSKEKLIILISGVHGIEAFVGSAVQKLFVENYADIFKDNNYSILLIHSLNPYGHKYKRRVDENNIDLNRNFLIQDENYQNDSNSYKELNSLLNPSTEVKSYNFASKLYFLIKFIPALILKGKDKLTQSIVGGQYHNEKGLFYGGSSPSQQRELLNNIVRDKISAHKKNILIDLHTGYGEKGKLHLWAEKDIPEIAIKLRKRIFKNEELTFSKQKDFYKVKGGLTDYIESLIPPDKILLSFTFEYGTLDSQTTFGSLDSLYRMRVENQGNFFNYKSSDTKLKANQSFSEMFYPSDKDWRAKIIKQTKEVFLKINRFF